MYRDCHHVLLNAETFGRQPRDRERDRQGALLALKATVKAEDGTEVAWGVNAAETGVNVLPGIGRPDGTDVGVT